MATFSWAYVDCENNAGSGSAGPPHSLQFVTESGGATTGSAYLTYYTGSGVAGRSAHTLYLTGTLIVTGAISASSYHIENITQIGATGSTYFGDDQTDTHARTGSFQLYSDSAQVFKIDSPSGNLSGSGTLTIVGATTLGSTLAVSGTATLAANLNVIQSSNNSIMSSSNHNGDIIFHGNSAQEIGRFDGSAGTLLMNTNKKIRFADGGEYVVSNGTDLTVASGADIILAPAGGDVLPDGDGTRNLGSAGKRWANVYTADLHLKNDRGNWTVVEEEDCLTLRNNNTGKKYKLLMEEID